jgi:hypothetical protein
MSAIVNIVRSPESGPVSPGDFYVLREPPQVEPEVQHETEAERLKRMWLNGD